MCGLLGFLTADVATDDVVQQVYDALQCGRHRGPDERGTWHDEHIILGFNRLSIIDIDHSHQPLRWGPADNPQRYALAFNGEIYNYLELREQLAAEHGARFHTEGDGESIVAAYHHWGTAAFSRLRGMFAFAIWDTETRQLVLGRDPFGIKPMFLATGPNGTAYASEKKSLLELLPALGLSDALDVRALEHYTVLQYVPEPESLHRDVRRLESGCYATLTPGEKPAVTRYFEPTFRVRPFAVGGEERRYREIAEVLEDSVAKHMRADVTVGAFLSGGIDSTATAALAIRHNPNLLTFTSAFEREGYSEADVAAETAAAIGAKHFVRMVSPAEYAAAIPEIVWYLDDPVADPALVPLYFVAKEARKHVKVVLSGEGADELFGGYTIYREPLSLRPFEYLPRGVRRLAGALSDRIPEGTRGKSLLHRGSLTLEERYYGNARSFNDAQLRAVLRDFRPEWTHRDVTAPIYARSRGWDPVARMQHLDLFTWLRGDILVKADKMTMANSLELRVPFLDPEVFRIAEQLPYEQKLTKETTKYALRKALETIVPPHVLHRPKLGFPVPLRHWLRGPELYDWAAQQIAESQTDHLLDKSAIKAMLESHRQGPTDHSRRLWTLLIFMIWHGIFVEDRIKPDIQTPTYPVRL
ncbi:asparagine synthase (glutamine-hydrolyzing) [Nocardia terpenica]|uniref:asparagine synthase (glutamine-hydrolyzing) n=1 Tax=Nocardia terpenica TaxID=455432 RepID=A0A164NAP7_9NOCA|nr:asparagine synthase (glutamine-hydrolyzing) [Nocardia terpenica]KZM74160.1 asparagine synthetase B [Nocardia terpenica]MBF6064543.1 asparagine synthase (glutamine-hydrolyzing) [Nocardia terpenica]MBF6106833.1 asparagine synthase (glutamine-hydrolyzing) [Nocardia terpenica]MBF6114511.1 asparagine synthase (glutamine-hydrolyzing) [Nocardia terpenica]MBF6121403.1 asparagine synthase (glutamine-hydrolyzing) [Nocardia terpenica]